MIWDWANDPAVRAVSFSSETIPWESHSQWFHTKLLDPDCLFYIALGPDDMPIGQIRYQVEDAEAVVSVSLAPDQRGKGYGSQVIQFASQKVFADTSVERIHAYIKPDNVSSLAAFSRAGFSDSGLIKLHGSAAKDYILQRNAEK